MKKINLSNLTSEEIQHLKWETECRRLELENQNDREYVERIAKMKADAYLEDIKPNINYKGK